MHRPTHAAAHNQHPGALLWHQQGVGNRRAFLSFWRMGEASDDHQRLTNADNSEVKDGGWHSARWYMTRSGHYIAAEVCLREALADVRVITQSIPVIAANHQSEADLTHVDLRVLPVIHIFCVLSAFCITPPLVCSNHSIPVVCCRAVYAGMT